MKKLVSITFLIVFAISAFAQTEVKKSTEKIKISGKIYYVHLVKQGETVFSLCQAYNVSSEDLLLNNPQLSSGLKTGQTLRIPEKTSVNASSEKTSSQNKATEIISNAQTREPQTEQINYRKHKVKKKDSLQSIASKYNCSVYDIISLNPSLSTGAELKKGQYLTIPPEYVAPRGTSITYHTIEHGDTLYSLSHMYGLSETEIRQSNPAAFNERGELIAGKTLKLYDVIEENTNTVVDTIDYSTQNTNEDYVENRTDFSANCDDFRYSGESLKVALLLPFGAKTQSSNYIEFYEGFLLGLDSVRRDNISVNLTTVDVFDEKSLQTALSSTEIENADMIIGPLQYDLMLQAADFAYQKQIPIISPLAKSDEIQKITDIAYNNPYFIESTTSTFFQNKKIADDISSNKNNVILIYKDAADSTLINEYKNFLIDCKKTPKIYQYVMIVSHNAELQNLMVSKEKNDVIVLSNDEVFVSDVVSKLNTFAVRNKMDITVYGSSRWKTTFKGIELTHLYNLNFTTSQAFYVDFSRNDVRNFVQQYRHYYKGDPSNFAFSGYDLCVLYISAMAKYGRNFVHCMVKDDTQTLLQSKFKFKHASENGGLINKETFILRHTPDMEIKAE